MKPSFNRVGDRVVLCGEAFDISDILSIHPSYAHRGYPVHFYDGRKHYVSDGSTQTGLPVPYPLAEDLYLRIPELRMCRSQRENDNRYFENLRNGRK